MAVAVLAAPDAPLSVIQDDRLVAPQEIVDLAHEASRALVTELVADATGNTTIASLYPVGIMALPQNFFCSAQLLRWDHFDAPNPGQKVLNVLIGPALRPGTVLSEINDPRILLPALPSSGPPFALPFFVTDGGVSSATGIPRPARSYAVDFVPNATASAALLPAPEWNNIPPAASTGYFQFSSAYHPFARTFLRTIEVQSVADLFSRDMQLTPSTIRGWDFSFPTTFRPTGLVVTPLPGIPKAVDAGESWLDFSSANGGAYSLYNWELFYHAPMFVASLLMQNQQYADAMTWLSYIFNPNDTSPATNTLRFWQTAPLYQDQDSWTNQTVDTILSAINSPLNSAALNAYQTDPFDADAIASLRIGAYAKATFMKYLDNLIAWGDSLFSTYTSETVARAEQLYVLADLFLGPQPAEVPPPTAVGGTPTYALLQPALGTLASDPFSQAVVAAENLIVAPMTGSTAGATPNPLPVMPLFCIPPNSKLLAYWDTIADRLYKIRQGLNLQGQAVPLPLYASGINPLSIGSLGGLDSNGAAVPAPIYRFATYLQKSVELTNDVRAFGGLLLSALEKRDAEALSALRATQEVDIQTRMVDIKTQQVTEATDQITALQQQKAVYQTSADYYSGLIQDGLNEWETKALALQATAFGLNLAAVPLDNAAGAAQLVPSFIAGVDGFGGTPSANASFGGSNIAGALTAGASTLRGLAGLSQEAAGIASTMGGYQRRGADWTYQVDLATAQMVQLDAQLTAANDRLAIAQKELDLQNAQLTNANAISTFLTQKYTNTQLYDWMAGQLTTVYTQAYQLAFGLAQQAQRAFQYELCNTTKFLQAGYWDSQHKGLLAGECLLFDLRRMESAYLAENVRELELTKTVSLAMTKPEALVALLQSGMCNFALDEWLFDADHPGHYFRRLRSVALTVPCVTGPYVGVNADLMLLTEAVRYAPPTPGYTPQAGGVPADGNVFRYTANIGTSISTSTGQNDAGLFDVNLRDERWLPFEGQGAISYWQLSLKAGNNAFDLMTISDVLLHVRYSARSGAGAPATVAAPSAPPPAVLISVKSMFPDAFAALFDGGSATPSLTLPLGSALLPYSSQTPTFTNLALYVLSPGSKVTAASVTVTPALAGPQTYTLGMTITPDPTQIEDLWVLVSYSLPTS